jgi:hypothetical protein
MPAACLTDAGCFEAGFLAAVARFDAATGGDGAAPSGWQVACAHRGPTFEISSPGAMPDEHTPQDAGYLAMSVMPPA